MRHTILTQSHQDLGHLARHMTDIMTRVLHSSFSTGQKPPDWVPAVDICEMCDHWEVIVEVAGVRREDIEVYTENRHLTIAGWRHDPTSPEKIGLHQMEIEQGQFRQAFGSGLDRQVHGRLGGLCLRVDLRAAFQQ